MNYRMDDLRALIALHQTLSFARAAERLHITQSAFSRRISQLEDTLEGRLVERSTRRVVLSPLGLELVSRSAPLLAGLDDCLEDARRQARGEVGRVVVACLTTVAHALLPPALVQFRRQFPDVRLQLRDDTGKRVTASVLQHEAEFGISVLTEPVAGLHEEHVADDPYVVAFSPGHPLEASDCVPWSALAAWRPVALRSTSANRQQIDETLAAAGIAPPWFDEVEHLSSMLGLLRSDGAVGVLPRLALRAAGAGLSTRPLVAPAIGRRIGMIRRQGAVLGRPAQVLWTLLADALKGDRPAAP